MQNVLDKPKSARTMPAKPGVAESPQQVPTGAKHQLDQLAKEEQVKRDRQREKELARRRQLARDD